MVEITDCEIVGTRVRVINNAGNVPAPVPNRIETVLIAGCANARSSLPSALKSPRAGGACRFCSIADRGREGAVPIACQGREAT